MQGNTEMIRVSVEVREDGVTRRVRISARSMERALKMAGSGGSVRRMRLLSPPLPETVVSENHAGGRAA